MKKFFLIFSFIILFLVQTTFGEQIKIFGVLPNLLLVFTIVYSVNTAFLSSALVGAVAGLLTDVSMNGIIGINALLLMYVALFVSFLSSKILYDRNILTCITVFVVGCIYEFLSAFISNIFIHNLPVFYVTYRYILLSGVYNTIVSIPLIYLLNKLKFEYIRGI